MLAGTVGHMARYHMYTRAARDRTAIEGGKLQIRLPLPPFSFSYSFLKFRTGFFLTWLPPPLGDTGGPFRNMFDILFFDSDFRVTLFGFPPTLLRGCRPDPSSPSVLNKKPDSVWAYQWVYTYLCGHL